MRITISSFFIIILLTFCSCGQKKELTANEIWEKQLVAVFGETQPKITSRYSQTETQINDITIRTTAKVIFPDKVFQEVISSNGYHVIYILNGDVGVIIYPDKKSPMTSSEIELFKNTGLIFPEPFYQSVNLKGVKKLGDNEFYIIEVEYDNYKTTNYIDTKTFLTYKTIIGNSTIEVLERKNVNGISLLQSYRIISDNDTSLVRYIDDKINVEISEEIFNLK